MLKIHQSDVFGFYLYRIDDGVQSTCVDASLVISMLPIVSYQMMSSMMMTATIVYPVSTLFTFTDVHIADHKRRKKTLLLFAHASRISLSMLLKMSPVSGRPGGRHIP